MNLKTLNLQAKAVESNIISYVLVPPQIESYHQVVESIHTFETQQLESLTTKINAFTDRFEIENNGHWVENALNDCNKMIRDLETIFNEKI
ncbi:hypothetical protein [Macrococcus sp. DPC7161]|uniref:hypothetical protein n=1 Tax=Macrococcus sp. DPC7161 TaxID=2507060 RepID=UPI00100C265A|nr:hypothetical protein [Macrococcus sp. DPC7161]RXK18350.1 hypothetical protein ER639_06575 [Macrococcus sp. DPC7161]